MANIPQINLFETRIRRATGTTRIVWVNTRIYTVGDPVILYLPDKQVHIHGTVLSFKDRGVRVLLQTGVEEIFAANAFFLMNVVDPGIDYFPGDEVLVFIHDPVRRQSAVVNKILSLPVDTAEVTLDGDSSVIGMPFSHMVLLGDDPTEVQQIQSNWNI